MEEFTQPVVGRVDTKELNMSDGNLGANLKKLEALKLIKSKKMFVGAKPKTLYRITKEGQANLQSFSRFPS